jgi:hypothetical protein
MGQSAEATTHVVETNDLDDACEQAIEACGGDARSAVRSLLILTNYLEHELDLAKAATSLGYRRGRAQRVTRAELAERIADDARDDEPFSPANDGD